MDKSMLTSTDRQQILLSNGTQVTLPWRYDRWSSISAVFTIPFEKAQNLLPTKKLKPALLFPGKSVINFSAFDYPSLDSGTPELGAYKELAVMIPVIWEEKINLPALPLLFPDRFKQSGFYLHRMAVTSPAIRDASIELWGYSKYVAEISFEDEGDFRSCKVQADGKQIITLRVKKLRPKHRLWNLYSYSCKNDQILKTLLQAEGMLTIHPLPGGASYTLGDHPEGEALKELGPGKMALGRAHGEHMQSLLHAATVWNPE
jgi:hypothetical protein